MKHKKVLLILSFCILFIFQQLRADAKVLPEIGNPSPIESHLASGLPSTVLVFMKEFDLNGGPTDNPCFQGDTSDGCVQPGAGLAYPPSSPYVTFEYAGYKNPIRVDVEHYYLHNVLPREMDVAKNYPTLAALKAQALAARTYADFKAVPDEGHPGHPYITNVTTKQVFVPGSYQ